MGLGRTRGRIIGSRLVSALPLVLLSGLLVTFAFEWLGRYTLLPVLAWLLVGPLLLVPRPVERSLVRSLLRFYPPSGREAERLRWLESRSADLGATAIGALDWYVTEDPRPNAFAAGRYTIAVTTGLLRSADTGELAQDELLAVALHEVGHHATGGVRYGLMLWWWTWPWRSVHRIAVRLSRRLPFSGVATRLLPLGCTVAVWRIAVAGDVTSHMLEVMVALTATGVAIGVQPLIEKTIDRLSERAADAYVAMLGEAFALTRARQCLRRERIDTLSPPSAARQAPVFLQYSP